MSNRDLSSVIKTDEALIAYLTHLPSVDEIKLRPNVIYDIVYDKSVLHLGCTDHLDQIESKLNNGRFLHRQLTWITNMCLGIDINEQTVNYLKDKGIANIVAADITQPGIGEIISNKWDYLLIAEVLEHIDNPVLFLRLIAQNYKEYIDKVIITVPNAFGGPYIDNAARTGIESINSDHRYWFSPYTIYKIARQAGLILDDLIMCVYEGCEEFAANNRALLTEKPLLMDNIVLVAHWGNK